VKSLKVAVGHAEAFRAAARNLLYSFNLVGLSVSLNARASSGGLSSTIGAQSTSARVMQMTLRYDF